MNGTAVQMVISYLDEHMWREWYGWISTPAFINLEKQSKSHTTAAISHFQLCHILKTTIFTATNPLLTEENTYCRSLMHVHGFVLWQ